MREKKIKQERKETVKLKFSPKVSHLEGSIVSSLSHREFNFAFPLSILRHTSSLFCVFLCFQRSPYWQSGGGGMKLRSLLISFVPSLGKMGMSYSSARAPRLIFSAATIFLVFITLSLTLMPTNPGLGIYH